MKPTNSTAWRRKCVAHVLYACCVHTFQKLKKNINRAKHIQNFDLNGDNMLEEFQETKI